MNGSMWLIALALATGAAVASPELGDDARVGWHFYDDPPPPVAPAPPAKPVATTPARPSAARKVPELQAFEQMQRTMEELRDIAIVKPTDENVRRYMVYERMVTEKASKFADVAQRVAWNNPELDSTIQGRPTGRLAGDVYDRENVADTRRRLTTLARDHAVFFFFRSDCPYCHAFAPIVARLQAYGLRVEPVSLDGGGLPEFPHPRTDNGIAERLGVRQVPAVFLAQPFKGEISAVSYGVLSSTELEHRVVTVADQKPRPAELFPTVAVSTP